MTAKTKTLLCALAVMLLWGSLFPTVKLGFAAFGVSSVGDILLFAGLRFAICGGLITAFSLARKRESFLSLRTSLLPVLLSGLFAIVLHYGCSYTALSMTTGSKTAILKQSGSLFYICFSFLFFKDEKPSIRKLLGAAVGILGILSANGFSIQRFGLSEVLIIAASFCTVASNIVSKKTLTKVDPLVLTGVSQLFGGLLLTAVGGALGGKVHFTVSGMPIFLAILAASIVSYLLWFSIVKGSELSGLFIIKFAEPLFAALFGALLLGENILRPSYLISFLLISLGITISSAKRS